MSATPSSKPLTKEEVRERVVRAFKFLAEVARRRNPVMRRWQEHDWKQAFSDLPEHPYVQRMEQSNDGRLVILRVKRPKETQCPPPPHALADWLTHGWGDINQEIEVLQSRNIGSPSELLNGPNNDGSQPFGEDSPKLHSSIPASSRTIEFKDATERVRALELWRAERDKWRVAERPVRRVLALFQRLFELRGRLQRESERLVLWVGDGLLKIEQGRDSIEYPLLVQRCELIFDPSVPQFEIRETDDPPEFSTQLLRELGVDGRLLLQVRQKLDALDLDILDSAASDFLAEMSNTLFPSCEFVHRRPFQSAQHPIVFRDPVIFVSMRSGGMMNAIDGFLNKIQETGEIPGPLENVIVAEEVEHGPASNDCQGLPQLRRSSAIDNNDDPPLLTKRLFQNRIHP